MSVGGEREIPALRVELRASRALACALALAHAAAAGAAMVALPQWYARVLAGVALLANACWTLRRHALLRAPGAVVALDFRGECECSIARRDGSRLGCRVQGSSYVSTWLVVLHLEEPGRRLLRYVVLAPDSVAPDRLRRLRVRLRWASPYDAGIAARNAPL
ncbi:MAG: protein YgfX [Burkholderiales bacterium]